MGRVKSWRRAAGWALLWLGLLLISACAVSLRGVVSPVEGATVLETVEGERYRLVLPGDAAPLRWLDGHTAEVEGRRLGRAVTVSDWKVLEGLHGMPTWVGVLEQRGAQIGLHDRNSGAYYFVDRVATEALWPYVGLPVLLEGYVVGAHRVRVLYYRVLAEEPTEAR